MAIDWSVKEPYDYDDGDGLKLAQEVLCFTPRRFLAHDRAMWHLAHLRRKICVPEEPTEFDWSRIGEGARVLHILPAPEMNEKPFGRSVQVARPGECFRLKGLQSGVLFLSARYHFVFCIDLSPSISVVDTSFKGMSTGTFLFDSIHPCLKDTLCALLAKMHIGGHFEPEIYITVLAYGSPAWNSTVLAQCMHVSEDSQTEFLETVRIGLKRLWDQHAEWLQDPDNHKNSGRDSSRTVGDDGKTIHQKCADMAQKRLQMCLLALSTSSVPDTTQALVLFTDGVMCHLLNTVSFNDVLMHMNNLDIALHIVQVGGGFAPWSALGFCSDYDMLAFLGSSTPGGSILQDHHISHMLTQQQTTCSSTVPIVANQVQKAWLLKRSALNADQGQSSLMESSSYTSAVAGQQAHTDSKNYSNYLQQLGCKNLPKTVLDGLDEPGDRTDPGTPPSNPFRRSHPSTPSRVLSRVPTASPILRAQLSTWSLPDDGFSLDDDCGPIPLYAAPGSEGDSWVYDEMSYHLYNVALGQIVQCRVRQGFRLLEVGVGGSLKFGLTWRPMFNIFYTIYTKGSKQVSVMIQSQMPSHDYLKFSGGQNLRMGKHRAELVSFVRSLSATDDALRKITELIRISVSDNKEVPRASLIRSLSDAFDPGVAHTWFSMHRFDYILNARTKGGVLNDLHRRLGHWATDTLVHEQRYWRVLDWITSPSKQPDDNFYCALPPSFWCQCCSTRGDSQSFPLPDVLATFPMTDATTPCCLVQVDEIKPRQEGSECTIVTVRLGTMGLCPDAENAFIEAFQSHFLGSGTRTMLGFCKDASSGVPLASIGRIGILSSLVLESQALPLAGNLKRGHNVKQRSGFLANVSEHGQLRSPVESHSSTVTQTTAFSNAVGNAEDMACAAMDGLGPIGGSFFTFAPDWRLLKTCMACWDWPFRSRSSSAAERAFDIVQHMRSREGWHCLYKSTTMCCFVKQLPLWGHAMESVDLGATSLMWVKMATLLTEESRRTRRKILNESQSSDVLEAPLFETEGVDSEPQKRSPHESGHSKEARGRAHEGCKLLCATEDGTFKMARVEEETKDESATQEMVAPEEQNQEWNQEWSIDTSGWDADTTSAQPFKMPASRCTLYYRVSLESPEKKLQKSFPRALSKNSLGKTTSQKIATKVKASLWLDAPPGAIDLSLLPAVSAKVNGPFCDDLQLPAGKIVRLRNWKLSSKVGAVRAHAVVPSFLPCQVTVELRFFKQGGELALALYLENGRETERRCKKGSVDIAYVEAYSPLPAILCGIWIEQFQGQPLENKDLSPHKLGERIYKELQKRDSLVVEAGNFIEEIDESTMSAITYWGSSRQFQSGRRNDLRASSCPTFMSLMPEPQTPPELLHTQLQALFLCLERKVSFPMDRPCASSRQHTFFVQQIGLLDGVHRHVHYKVDDNNAVSIEDEDRLKDGDYFFLLHSTNSRRRTTPVASSDATDSDLRFTLLIVPSSEDSLTIIAGDGNVDALQKPSSDDACVAAVLSSHGYSSIAKEDQEFNERPLSRFTENLVKQVKAVHNQTCAEAIFEELHERSATLNENEIDAALRACKKASTVLPVDDLIAAADWPAAKTLWSLLDSIIAKTLETHGYKRVEGYTAQPLSWLYFRAAGQPVNFIRVEIKTGGTKVTTEDASNVSGNFDGCSLFQAAFDAGGVEEARLTAYYLPLGSGEEITTIAWGPSSPTHPRQYNMAPQRLRWEGMTKLQALSPQLAEQALRLGEDIAAALEIAHSDLLRSEKPTSISTVQTVHHLLQRLADWKHTAGAQVVPFQQKFLHSDNIYLPIARPRSHAKAHKNLVASLAEMANPGPMSVGVVNMCQVADAVPNKTVFVMLDPKTTHEEVLETPCSSVTLTQLGEDDSPTTVARTISIANTVASDVPTLLSPPSVRGDGSPRKPIERQASKASFESPLVEPPVAYVEPPSFWALIVINDKLNGEDSEFLVQVFILFTPSFCKSFLQGAGELPQPEIYYSRIRDALTKAAIRMNQTLLMDQMFTDGHLSELLLPEFAIDAGANESKNDADLTPHGFLKPMESEEVAEETKYSPKVDGKPPTRSGSKFSKLSTKLEKTVGIQQAQEDYAYDRAAAKLDDDFAGLLTTPGALFPPRDLRCQEQGSAKVRIPDCLFNFSIISWLGGGTAESGRGNTSTKVGMRGDRRDDRRSQAQVNEVASIFARQGLATKSGGAWILWVSGKGAEGQPYFVRPCYEKEGEVGKEHVQLQLKFYGLSRVKASRTREITKKLVTQLERLAIVKLLHYVLDRQQKATLSNSVLDFVCPIGQSPRQLNGDSLLLSIPLLQSLPHYAQFVRRAVLGLLEHVSSPLDRDHSIPEHGESQAETIPSSMTFMYKRLAFEQITLDVTKSKERGQRKDLTVKEAGDIDQVAETQRRDKVSEKVLQFQGRVGDGIALAQLHFISSETGRIMESMPKRSDGPLLPEISDALHGKENANCVQRRDDGRFKEINAENLDSSCSGYLLLDIWQRAIQDEQLEQLKEELHIAVDQALREYRLQSLLGAVEKKLDAKEEAAEGKEVVQKALQNFQHQCVEQLDRMPNQHLSSLLSHSPDDIAFNTQEDGKACFPPWAYMKTLQGLSELLKASRWGAPLITMQCSPVIHRECSGALHDKPEEFGDYYGLFDIDDLRTSSLQIRRMCEGTYEARPPLNVEKLAEYANPGLRSTWSPQFVFMWGSPIAAWRKRFIDASQERGGSEDEWSRRIQAQKGKLETSSDYSDEFGFVSAILEKNDRLGLSRAEQQASEVREGGAACIKMHTFVEWNDAQKSIEDDKLAATFFIVILDASGARFRGVNVDPVLLLWVQYYLRKQFAWVWFRSQILGHMCACELQQRVQSLVLYDKLKKEFPWIFEKKGFEHRQYGAQAASIADDHSEAGAMLVAAAEGLADSSDEDEDDGDRYLVFGLPRVVADNLMMREVVLAPTASDRPDRKETLEDARCVTSNKSAETGSTTTVQTGLSSTANVFKKTGGCFAKQMRRDRRSVASTRDGTLSRSYNSRNSYTNSNSMSSKLPSSTSPKQHLPKSTKSEVGWKISKNKLRLDVDTASKDLDCIQDVGDVLVGVDLVSSAIGDRESLIDPLSQLQEAWRTQADCKMSQHLLKLQIKAVLSDWEGNKNPITKWAKEVVSEHETRADSGPHLIQLADDIKQKVPWCSELQDLKDAASGMLLLSLIHEAAVSLVSPFKEKLFIASKAAEPSIDPRQRRRDTTHQHGETDTATLVHQVPFQMKHEQKRVLPGKLLQTVPLLTTQQRFLSSLLAAFTRPAKGPDRNSIASGWTLVCCLENPLPWHDWDVFSESLRGVQMRPQTLLLHRTLRAVQSELLVEVSCRAHNEVQVEIFSQKGGSEELKKHAEEVSATLKDFCFDFRLRSLIDSYNASLMSLGSVWCDVEELLKNDEWTQVRHPARARNLVVRGTIPRKKLSMWLQGSVGGATTSSTDAVGLPIGLKAQNLVGFMHTTAESYGFDCHGEAHKPLLAMSALDHNFVHVLREKAAEGDLLVTRAASLRDVRLTPSPVAQGLRCVLFASPEFNDVARAPPDSITGELGFCYVVILVDFAWCMPPCTSTGSESSAAEWEKLAATLENSAEKALTAFTELAIAKLVSMRRLQVVSRYPQRSKLQDFREVLSSCCTKFDLVVEPLTRLALEGLKRHPATTWTVLAPYLKSVFSGRCCEIAGNLGNKSAKHLFIITTIGTERKMPHAEERHYLLLQLVWSPDTEALEHVWLHSSHRVNLKNSEVDSGPNRLPNIASEGESNAKQSLPTYVDELDCMDDDPRSRMPSNLGALAEQIPSTKASIAVALEDHAVDLVIRRFMAILVEHSLRESRLLEDYA